MSALKDLATLIKPAAYTSGAALNTSGYMSTTFIVPTQNTTSVALTESDDDSTYNDVAEAKIIVGKDGVVTGTLSGNDVGYTASGTGVIGYAGKKKYVKATVTNAVSNTTIHSVLGDPLKAPVA